MATTTASQQALVAQAAQRRQVQQALAVSLAQQVALAFRLLNPAKLGDTLPLVVRAVQALVAQHAQAARTLANTSYQAQRAASGVTAPYRPVMTALPDPEQVKRNVEWATRPLLPSATITVPARLTVSTAAERAGQSVAQLVQETAHNQIIDNTVGDRYARGWVREAQPDACWFCAMLAVRGAQGFLYHSAEAAGREVVNGIDGNRYHTHCRCEVAPVFGVYEAPAHMRSWAALYDKATAEKTGAGKAWAFQEAFEGREISRRTPKWSGYSRKHGTSGRGKMPKDQEAQTQIAAGMTEERARQALDRAKTLYLQEGDPVGDRTRWIRTLEQRIPGAWPWKIPTQQDILTRLTPAELAAARDVAGRLIGTSTDQQRLDWISALDTEIAERG